jgi:hypothetical protein
VRGCRDGDPVRSGLASVGNSGWPRRFDAPTLQLPTGTDDRNLGPEDCPSHDADDLSVGKACRLSRADSGATAISDRHQSNATIDGALSR